MCQKGSNVFKHFYALVIRIHPCSAPVSLQVFKLPPTQKQIESVLKKTVLNKTDPSTQLNLATQLDVVPIQIPVNILH
jgi:hypothetical protein